MYDFGSDRSKTVCINIWNQIQIMVILSNPNLHLQGVYIPLPILAFVVLFVLGLAEKGDEIMQKRKIITAQERQSLNSRQGGCQPQCCLPPVGMSNVTYSLFML
jgi:hypothetical protein